jgi:CRP/FNR family transcriptional regulator
LSQHGTEREERVDKKAHIAQMPLFEGISETQQQDLASIALLKTFERGETIFSDGEAGNGFYVVLSGRIKIFKLSADGKEQILHIFGPGEPFGEVPVFEGRRFPANSEPLEKSSVMFFPRTAFIDLIKRNPSLVLNMLGVLSRRLRRFAAMIDDLSLKEVPGRLAAHLLDLNARQPESSQVALTVPKNQLAAMLGTIPETLSRILQKMTQQGFIKVDGKNISLLDREGLTELAEGLRRLSHE